MQFSDLRKLTIAAALDLVDKAAAADQPGVPPTVVVPGGSSTRLLTLTGFPDDDEGRHDYLAQFAEDQLSANRVPAWGFVVSAEVNGVDAVVAVYGARRQAPQVTAAPMEGDELGNFVEAEDLDPTAMPFLHPLQHAVDALPSEPIDRLEGPLDHAPDAALPLHDQDD